jgi:hypothetical protein
MMGDGECEATGGVNEWQGRPKKSKKYVRLEVFMAVTMKNGIFWDVTLCASCKDRRFGGIYRLKHQGDKSR